MGQRVGHQTSCFTRIEVLAAAERLAAKGARRHAPVSRGCVRLLVGFDHCFQTVDVAHRSGIEFLEIEAGGGRGARQVIAFVPVLRATPDGALAGLRVDPEDAAQDAVGVK